MIYSNISKQLRLRANSNWAWWSMSSKQQLSMMVYEQTATEHDILH